MPLLVHKHDQHAVQGWDSEDHPRSVLSGRTNEQVAADPDRVWRSDAPAAEADVSLLPDALPDEAIKTSKPWASRAPGACSAESCG